MNSLHTSAACCEVVDSYNTKYSRKNSKYILTVGINSPRKNIYTLIKAYSRLPINLLKIYKLYLVGPIGEMKKEYEYLINKQFSNLIDRIVFSYSVNEYELYDIYKNADLFCCTSFEEGFCIPIVEAMYFKLPIIASNIETIKEVGNSAVCYADPFDEISFTNKMIELLTCKDKIKNMQELSINYAPKYSWEKTINEIVKEFSSN